VKTAELIEIVKDVPSDAWPWCLLERIEVRGDAAKELGPILDELVLLAFTGSMLEYVKEGGWGWQNWTVDKHKARTVSLEVPGHKFTVPMDAYPSGLWTVALLALACKQIDS
jgi:hypothetical protein